MSSFLVDQLWLNSKTQLDNVEPLRADIKTNILKNDQLESFIFDHTISDIKSRNNWTRYFEVISIIIEYPHLTDKVKQILSKHPSEYLPSKWKKITDEFKKKLNDEINPDLGNVTTMWTCSKCGHNKTSYYQLQTRSADEPMTTFVTCITCGNKWKC